MSTYQRSEAKLVALLEDDYIFNKGALETVYHFAKSNNFAGYYTFFNSPETNTNMSFINIGF